MRAGPVTPQSGSHRAEGRVAFDHNRKQAYTRITHCRTKLWHRGPCRPAMLGWLFDNWSASVPFGFRLSLANAYPDDCRQCANHNHQRPLSANRQEPVRSPAALGDAETRPAASQAIAIDVLKVSTPTAPIGCAHAATPYPGRRSHQKVKAGQARRGLLWCSGAWETLPGIKFLIF